MGYSASVNQALKECSSPYIVLMNPDSIVVNGFFESILKFMKNNKDIGVVGPKVLNRDGSVEGSARVFPTFLFYLLF